MAGQLTIDTLKASSGVLATQNGMTGIAKAWVNFVGSSASINGSFNVSSVTRSSTGEYSVNFTTAMANANYSAIAICNANSTTNNTQSMCLQQTSPLSTGSCLLQSASTNANTSFDPTVVCCVIFGS